MYFLNQKTELRLDPTREPGYIAGYASKFNGIDSYQDTIEPGAYDNVVRDGPLPKMFFNHGAWDIPVGIWKSWKTDEDGLWVEGALNLELQQGRDLYEAIKIGSIDGLSVSIRLASEDFYYDDSDIRHIKNVRKMREISLCTFPADNSARIISYKSAGDDLDDITSVRDMEGYLREAGIPISDAKAYISAMKRIIQSENDAEKARRDAEAQKAERARKLGELAQALSTIARN